MTQENLIYCNIYVKKKYEKCAIYLIIETDYNIVDTICKNWYTLNEIYKSIFSNKLFNLINKMIESKHPYNRLGI